MALRAAGKTVRGILPMYQTKYKQVKYKELYRMQEVEIIETIFCECWSAETDDQNRTVKL